jgi:hypothetical protein
MKNTILWDVTPNRAAEVHMRFDLHGRRVSQQAARENETKNKAGCALQLQHTKQRRRTQEGNILHCQLFR